MGDFICHVIFYPQAHIAVGKYRKAEDDLSKAIDIRSNSRLLFARGVVKLLLQV